MGFPYLATESSSCNFFYIALVFVIAYLLSILNAKSVDVTNNLRASLSKTITAAAKGINILPSLLSSSIDSISSISFEISEKLILCTTPFNSNSIDDSFLLESNPLQNSDRIYIFGLLCQLLSPISLGSEDNNNINIEKLYSYIPTSEVLQTLIGSVKLMKELLLR